MLQSKRTLHNQQISVPNSKRKVTMKTCLESLLGKTSPKSIFLIPPFFTWFPSSYFCRFLHFSHYLIMLIFFFFIFKLPLGAEYPKDLFQWAPCKGSHKANPSLATPGHGAVPFHNETQSGMFSSNIGHNSCQWDCGWSQRMEQVRGNTTGKNLHISQTAQRGRLQSGALRLSVIMTILRTFVMQGTHKFHVKKGQQSTENTSLFKNKKVE